MLPPPPGSLIAIVGGCGGIGRALKVACVQAGLAMAVLDLPAALEAHPPEDAAGIPVDVTDVESITAAFAALPFPALDVLVNLADIPNRPVAFDALEIAEWDAVMATNLRSTYLTAPAALPMLQQGRDLAIVNLASGLAVRLMPCHSACGVTKAGVVAFTKALAVELAPHIPAGGDRADRRTWRARPASTRSPISELCRRGGWPCPPMSWDPSCSSPNPPRPSLPGRSCTSTEERSCHDGARQSKAISGLISSIRRIRSSATPTSSSL